MDESPTGLRNDVVDAWRAVQQRARADGITACLNDGKRSRAQQRAQYEQYLQKYGKAVADDLVLPPDKSAHVTGVAIDVQPEAAHRWLEATGGSFGFCRIYANEAWYFEYDARYPTEGCPRLQARPQR